MPNNRLSSCLIIILFFASQQLLAHPLCQVQWGQAKVEKDCLIIKEKSKEPTGFLIKGFKWSFNRETLSLKMSFKNPMQLAGFKLSFLIRGKVAAHYTLPLYTDPHYNIFQHGIETWLSIPVSSLDWVIPQPQAREETFNGLTLYLAHKNREEHAKPLQIEISAFKQQEKPSRGFVSITFDDGYATNFLAAQIMAKYKLKGTAYLIASSLNTKGYLTTDNIKKMKSWGWSMSTHLAEPITKQRNLEKVLKSAKKAIEKWDTRGASHFALPLGKYNEEALNTLKKYFKTIRLAGGSFESLPLTDPSRLKTINVTRDMSPQKLIDLCQKAISNGDWAILMFHYLDHPQKGDLSYPSQSFREFAQHLAPLHSQILPVDQVYSQ